MSPGNVALTLIAAIVIVGSSFGFYAGSRYKMDLEQWTVGNRGFGMVFVWLLMAGEIYTTFTFLGASGRAYSWGAPVYYILGYNALAFVVSFYIYPNLWEVGKKYRLQTQADFFRIRYGSRYLEAFVALTGVVFLIPYVEIQLTGMGLIVDVASLGKIHRIPAMVISFTIVAGFVLTSGMRGAAWVSVVKDLLLLIAALVVGIAIPYHYFGGIGPMFHTLAHTKPDYLVLPGATKNLGRLWFVSTVLMTSLAFFMWPQYIGACFSAKEGKLLRRNAVIMPLYGITMPLMFIVGFTALLVLPNLPNGDLAMLSIVQKTFPAWFLGIIGGAGALTAMVPASVQILTASTLLVKNICRPMLAPSMTDQQVARLAKAAVVGITVVALSLAIANSSSLVEVLLIGYAGVAQFFPGIVLGLYSRRATTAGVFAGLVLGVGIVAFLILTKRDPLMGWNAGFIGLCCNFAAATAVSLLRPARQYGSGQRPLHAVSE